MRSIVTLCVIGIFLLLPVQCIKLPMNLALVDLAAMATIPIAWVYLARSRLSLRFPYFVAMLVLFSATGVAALAFPISVVDSFVTALTELYLYALLFTVAILFERADPRRYRLLLFGWLAAVLGNGVILLMQFLQPSLLGTMNSALGSLGTVDQWRPSGLFSNCNAAATFQVTGLVPLLLLRLPVRQAWPLGGLLFAMAATTGSMGALLALFFGTATTVIAFASLLRSWEATVKIAMGTILVAGVGIAAMGALVIQFPSVGKQIEYVSYGRADRSSSGRMDLWTRGIETMLADGPTWGIGAGGYQREIGHEAHNDLIGVTVERGLLGTTALLLFALFAVRRSLELIRLGREQQDRSIIVFPGVLVAIAINSLTHEVFHLREVWLVLAVQEAVLWRLRARAQGSSARSRQNAIYLQVAPN